MAGREHDARQKLSPHYARYVYTFERFEIDPNRERDREKDKHRSCIAAVHNISYSPFFVVLFGPGWVHFFVLPFRFEEAGGGGVGWGET